MDIINQSNVHPDESDDYPETNLAPTEGQTFNLTGTETRYGDNVNKPGTCAIKMLGTDYTNAIVTGNPEVKTDGDYKILVWKQAGTLMVS